MLVSVRSTWVGKATANDDAAARRARGAPFCGRWAKKGTRAAPFDQEFFLQINLAVGGTGGYFPDYCLRKPSAHTRRGPPRSHTSWKGRLRGCGGRKEKRRIPVHRTKQDFSPKFDRGDHRGAPLLRETPTEDAARGRTESLCGVACSSVYCYLQGLALFPSGSSLPPPRSFPFKV